jgi:hypothetical protein
MVRRLAVAAMAVGFSAALATAIFAADSASQPSPELKELERKVSLKIAHASGEGPIDPAKRAQLHEAQQLDVKAEQAIAAGDYDSAQEDLVKANAILGQLSM